MRAADPPTAAYVHIPFCRRRCFYCDFPIAVAGDQARGETSATMAAYVETLCREIRATPVLGSAAAQLTTVFFGGGTPSLLAVEQVGQILHCLDQRFGIAAGAEISMEMDPGTFGRSQLQGLKTLGISRVSLGVQAFQDELLAACGRTHRCADIDRAVADLQGAAIPTWSLDLISGLPHQTLDIWQDSLECAIALHPQHISVYDLTVEPGTVFHRRYHAGDAPLPPDDATTTMYRWTQATLTAAGYDHYEISNYAYPGHQCRHNRVYWENRPYYGFGMGATSYTQYQRFGRPRTTHAYQQWVLDYEAAGGQLNCARTPLKEQWLDRLMVGLRLAEGVPLSDLPLDLGPEALVDLKRCLAPHQEQGWVQWSTDPYPHLRLTDPEGFLFSNQVLVTLFADWCSES